MHVSHKNMVRPLQKQWCGYLHIFYSYLVDVLFIVTLISCPVQDGDVEMQKIFWKSFTLHLPFLPNIIRRVKSSRVKEFGIRHLASGEIDKQWQGRVRGCNRKWCGVTHPTFFILISSFSSSFHPHFYSVFPSFISDVSSNVTVGRNLWYAGSYWQVVFGNRCS